MSDPVSLTLAIAPLVGGMFKSYQVAYRKIKTFGRADREVDRLRRALGRQRDVFVNEMHLILRLAVDDEDEIEAMVSNADNAQWASSEFSKALKVCLGRNYQSFHDIVEDISTNIGYLLRELERFEALEDDSSRLKDKAERLRSAAKVAFDKGKCDKAVQGLRTANGDMQTLREQTMNLQLPKPCPRHDRKMELGSKLRPSYASCAKIRRASKALHEGLSRTLPSHHHDVRLFLEATVIEDHTITNLAILCASQAAVRRNIVQVRSRPIEWLDDVCAKEAMVPDIADAPRKRRKVRWLDEEAERKPEPAGLDPSAKVQTKTKQDLPVQDLCLEIDRASVCHDGGSIGRGPKDCLCYVETSLGQTFRHEFYSRGGQIHRPTELATFDDIFLYPVESSVTMVDQLKLARTMVSAVLYFSSTPWLGEYWGMKDLCFFMDRNDLSTSLRTLNLGVQFLGNEAAPLGSPTEGRMEGLDSINVNQESLPDRDQAMSLHGIRNLALHSLGVVLLQIGRWSRVEPDDVLEVRRLAQQIPRLGRKYRDLMQKCLDCDFGHGSNLAHPTLQQAVYEDVVEELDAMIRCLDLSNDDAI